MIGQRDLRALRPKANDLHWVFAPLSMLSVLIIIAILFLPHLSRVAVTQPA